VKSCTVCQTHQNGQQAETLLQHDIPDGPWQVVASDIFHLEGNHYVIVADYYTKMPFIRRLSTTSSSASVITALKQLFGEHGIPTKLVSDNGPQYDCNEFETFAANWGFQHITSSPRYPQSNGFIERMIQTIKKTMKKAEESNADIDLALLCLRTTPIDSNLPSPAELLYSRKPRSNLPVLDHPTPQNDAVRKCLKARQQTQKEYYDKTVKDLSPLHSGQQILMQDNRGTWTPATVVEKRPEPRSYTIRTPNGGLYRRNRRQLRDLPTKHITWADEKTDVAPHHPPCQRQQTNQPATSLMDNAPIQDGNQANTPPSPSRRSNRQIKPPIRLIETM
ncbi:DDE-type integrase/transposase/recombinase, partial [Thiolapillus sp.]|uniref:DDE-type integrase/transposase/recombinase n=1 Tax=Thiolapillus sp. TaxID=2017437 RepID=UPI003AF7E88E